MRTRGPHCHLQSMRTTPPGERSARAGFTLIELLIVVVIIGILVAIAIPKFAATKEEAYVAKMKSDLRNLATAQEAYTSDNSVYYGGAVPSSALVYAPSQSVAISITATSPSGWAAVASVPGLSARTCALFVGVVAAPAPATAEGLIACSP